MLLNAADSLRERAKTICDAYDARAAILAKLTQFDAETTAKLATLDKQVNAADSGTFEDVAGIQTALTLKEQRRRYREQRDAEREQLLASVQREASTAVAGINLHGFFADALAEERERAIAATAHFANQPEGRPG